MAKKATSFMKKKGKGWIKIWKSRRKNTTFETEAWTDGAMLVMNGYREFNFPPGHYYYDGQTGLIQPRKKSDFPDFKAVIPKSKGYHKAEIVTEYNFLKLLKGQSGLIVMLKGKGKDVKAFLDYEYYQYLTDRGYGDYGWKVKSRRDPILFYVRKELAAVVMPFGVEE